MENTKFTFANQLEFKAWAKKNGLNPDWYYFDSTAIVDAKDPCFCPDIPGVKANGKSTWREVLQKLSEYFQRYGRENKIKF